MAKVYFVRHQAAGFLYDSPFGQPPSEAQIAALTKRCFHVHGFGHSKTPDRPYWVRVEEFDVLGPEAVITVEDRTLKVINEAGVSSNAVSGIGKVS